MRWEAVKWEMWEMPSGEFSRYRTFWRAVLVDADGTEVVSPKREFKSKGACTRYINRIRGAS